MFNRNELTISMFYASTTDADGNRIATITLQVNDTEGSPVQSSQLCVSLIRQERKRIQSVSKARRMALTLCWWRLRITGDRTPQRSLVV